MRLQNIALWFLLFAFSQAATAVTKLPSSSILYKSPASGSLTRTLSEKISNDVVSIDDFAGSDSEKLVAALAAANYIVIPAGRSVGLTQSVSIPDGDVIENRGTITGAGALLPSGSFKLIGTGTIDCSLTKLGGYAIKAIAGDILVDGQKFLGNAAFGIGIVPGVGQVITSIRVTNNNFLNHNYAVLRNVPVGGSVTSAYISYNRFENGVNDPIEWNVGPNDINLSIDHNIIDLVNSTTVNGGIGIGVAGDISYLTYPFQAHNFRISYNILRRLRQGIHVESSWMFGIHDNTISEISESYSPTTGIASKGIVVYGSDDFSIHNNHLDATADISVNFGVFGGSYNKSPKNFSVYNNKANIISINAAGDDNAVMLSNNTCSNLILNGSPSLLMLRDNTINTAAETSGLTIDTNNANYIAFAATHARKAVLTNNTVMDSLGQANVTLTTFGFDKIIEHGNNFQVNPIGVGYYNLNRVIIGKGINVPFGLELITGDIIINDTTGARTLITGNGSLNAGVDTFTTTGQAANEVKSTNLVWTNYAAGGYHHVGQRINLSGIGVAAGVLTARVKKVYLNGADYRITLDRDWVTPGTGTITSTVPLTSIPM